ncbi:hypothetical protein L1987_52260 [Smallanthus sonchifolius]|uniref:Uncharacterized protein n=1 Tax=Smallanthus sonchifolius TaxID=185202 RepID=A0ACB9ETC3_9ASTR|nr:hypothetical protein L1987_52260 [Smallanthus sonchifolius]
MVHDYGDWDVVCFNGMIDGYFKCGEIESASVLFESNVGKNVGSWNAMVTGSLDQGKWIPGYVKRNSIELDGVLGTALLDMYAKLGQLDLAWDVFETMKTKEVCSWNAMIGGLAMHGRAKDAIALFLQMERQRVRPDDITFVGILNACAHGGLVDAGLEYFDTMQEVHGVEHGAPLRMSS